MELAYAVWTLVAITGSEEVGTCGFPSACAAFAGPAQCSAVLVHPQVVLLSLPCFDYDTDSPTMDFSFGELDVAGPVYVQVPREDCSFSDDFGFCLLPDPVEIPYAPILAGCEQSALHEGAELTIVGFGEAVRGTFNTQKRWGEVVVESQGPEFFFIEGSSAPCAGDSGGPAFLRLADGSWRTAGISIDNPCESPSTYAATAPRIAWIESMSGIDVTPCHDVDGLPDPGPECVGFYAGDASGGGMWNDLCADAPVGPDGGMCSGDAIAPDVMIVAPLDGEAFAAGPVEVTIEISAHDGAGLGIRDVRLEIDGDVQTSEDREPPYAFELLLPDGAWTIAAVARDWGGNIGTSKAIAITVGDVPAETDEGAPETTGDTMAPVDTSSESGVPSDTDDDDPEDDDTAGAPIDGPADARGCSCTATPTDPALVGFLALGITRRRRSRAADGRA